MSLVLQIREFLQDNGIALPIYMGDTPPSPDDLVVIYPSGGYAPDPDVPLINPTVMIHVRASKYPDAERAAYEIHNLFLRREMYRLGDLYVLTSNPMAPPTPIGRDENRRHTFSVNIRFKMQDI